MRPVRLSVRTSGFQPEKRGSIPLRDAIVFFHTTGDANAIRLGNHQSCGIVPKNVATVAKIQDEIPMKKNDIIQQLVASANAPLPRATSAHPLLYRDAEIAQLEHERIWTQDWLCVGLAAELKETGDYITFSVGNEPIFTVRDADQVIRSFSNICRHRMMILLEGSGNTNRVVCPYHAWTYALDGQLIGAGHMERTEGFDKSDICLPEVRTEVWNGWIYVTLNQDAPTVRDCLSDLNPIVAAYKLDEYVPVLKEDHIWDTNWKLLAENFMESYHLPTAHKATLGGWLPLDKSGFPDVVNGAFTYQTFEKTDDATYGVAHADNTHLHGVWRKTSVMPTVFPSHMYVLAPDHCWYLSLRPNGTGQVHVRFGVAIAPEVDAALTGLERHKWMSELTHFFDHVNKEDRFVVEGIFAGSGASLAAPGQLSWLEREIHDFQKYLAAKLR